ncbi:DUF669 domain-containing protein [Methylobacterium sp. D54C]
MANLGEAIDVDSIVPERGDFEPLPAGPYMVQVTDSDVIDTKAGTGKILKLTMEVMDGPHANRKLWVNLNFKNPNATAQRIAQEQIKQICDAVGHSGQLTDSEVLHYKPMRAQVVIRKDVQYGDGNELKRFSALSGSAPPAGKPAPEAERPAAASQGSRPAQAAGQKPAGRPWGGKAA